MPSTKKTNPDDQKIGANLRAIRLARGVSQMKLGEALGITFQQVQKYESGANRISGSRMVQITEFLNCSLSDLFAGTSSGPSKTIPMPSLSRQASRVATAFDRIKSPAARAKIMELVMVLATDESEISAEAA